MSFSGAMIQNAIYIAQQPPEWPVAAEDWERAAEETLDPGAFGYIAGGAGSESTMRANLDAFSRCHPPFGVALVDRRLRTGMCGLVELVVELRELAGRRVQVRVR